MQKHVIIGLSIGIVDDGVNYAREHQVYSAIKAAFIFGFGTFVIIRSFAEKKRS